MTREQMIDQAVRQTCHRVGAKNAACRVYPRYQSVSDMVFWGGFQGNGRPYVNGAVICAVGRDFRRIATAMAE